LHQLTQVVALGLLDLLSADTITLESYTLMGLLYTLLETLDLLEETPFLEDILFCRVGPSLPARLSLFGQFKTHLLNRLHQLLVLQDLRIKRVTSLRFVLPPVCEHITTDHHRISSEGLLLFEPLLQLVTLLQLGSHLVCGTACLISHLLGNFQVHFGLDILKPVDFIV
jgi:hypothetical protein